MSCGPDFHAAQRAGLDRALEQYHWRLCYDATEPWPEADPEDDPNEDEEDEEEDTP